MDCLPVATMDVRVVTVIVCSFNGQRTLESALRSIVDQKGVGFKLEIITVNNNSTDHTAKIMDQFKHECESIARIHWINIVERQQGLHFARLAGIRASTGSCIVFCDDDMELDSNYLRLVVQLFRDKSRRLGAVGGQGQLIGQENHSLPPWFFENSGSYAVGQQASDSSWVDKRGYLWGAGLAVRGEVLRHYVKMGIEPLLVGRVGSAVLSGDDFELCQWLLASGYGLWYESKLTYGHNIAPHRLREDYLERLDVGFALSWEILRIYHFYRISYLHKSFYLEKLFISCLKLIKFFKKYRKIERFLFSYEQYSSLVRRNMKVASITSDHKF